MNLVRIAFRNLGRKRARTALSLLAIAVGVFVVILAKATVEGSLETLMNNSIKLSSGHIRIIAREYQVKERLLSLNYPVDGFHGEGYESIVKELEQIKRVENVVPRLRFGAMVSKEEELEGLMGMGVDPVAEEKLVHFSRYIAAGRFIQPGKREAVMGYKLLDRLGLEVGGKFTLVFNTALGAFKGYTFTVVGSIESGIQYLDDGFVLVPLDVAQRMLNMGPAVTEILVMARNKNQVPGLLEEIRGLLEVNGAGDRYLAIPWYQHSGMIEYMRGAESAYNIVYFFILFLASFVVINTMVMIVNERRREIGMLSALGLQPRQILLLFMYEGGITGVFGSAIGVVFGSLLVKLLSTVGIQIPGVETVDKQIMITPKLYPEFSLEVVAFSFVAGILVTLVAVYWPSRQAARMEPTEALRV